MLQEETSECPGMKMTCSGTFFWTLEPLQALRSNANELPARTSVWADSLLKTADVF